MQRHAGTDLNTSSSKSAEWMTHEAGPAGVRGQRERGRQPLLFSCPTTALRLIGVYVVMIIILTKKLNS